MKKDNSLDKFVEKYPTYIEALDIIGDLKKQLERHNKYFNSFSCDSFDEFVDFISTFMLTPHEEQTLIKDLKKQLAEKEKEIVRLNKFLQAMKIREQDQDKISFAVEQLELARRRIDRLGYNENKCLNKKDCIEDCLEEIDNQINELKEGSNENIMR